MCYRAFFVVSGGRYDFIWVQKGLDVKNLKIESVYRSERTYPTPTIKIDEGATVKGLKISDVVTENLTGKPMNEIVVDGKVDFVG